jgi:uncharacterized protein (TIGR02284 family)
MATHSSLKKLHTALVDARKGYETAYNDTEAPQMKALFQSMMKLHGDAHAELHTALAKRGEAVDDGGSYMATVHEAVISIRAAITGLDQNALDSFADGEEKLLDYYDKAIADASGSGTEMQMLQKQRNALAARIAAMRRKAA